MTHMKNMTSDVCVIGAGAGGLTVASVASQMGAKVILVEGNKMGGDCLNTGCVPSKSLLAAAKAAKTCVESKKFGIHTNKLEVHFEEVMNYIKKVINTVSEHDSVERFEKLGVKVIQSSGSFLDEKTLVAGDFHIHSKRFVIATGSSPSIPKIPGLEKIDYLTNETIFSLKEKPEHLIVIGGGPIGCELSQAFALLGIRVSILEAFTILPKDEKDLVSIMRDQLISDGITIYEHCKILQINKQNNLIEVQININDTDKTITGTHLLIATGRTANISHLNLDAAKITYTEKGISVDKRLRTSNKRVFAIGDVIGHYQFTHIAGYHVGIVIKNILFRLPAKINYQAVPWVTYTTPELAHVGLSEDDASKKYSEIKKLNFCFKDNDRAITENKTNGSISVITQRNGKILGVSILGEEAGELLLPWIIAIQKNRKINEFVNAIIPYPTLSEINRQAASKFYEPILFSQWIKKIVRLLLKLP